MLIYPIPDNLRGTHIQVSVADELSESELELQMAVEMEELVRQRDAAQIRLNEVTERMKEAEQEAEQRVKELEKKTIELVRSDFPSAMFSLSSRSSQ